MNNPFGEEFKESNLEVKGENILTKIDDFEENIKLLNKLDKEYKALKDKIKKQMLELGKANNVDQLKWTTPKGIKITLSIGKKATFEEVVEKKFSEVKLASEYPEIYEACKVEVKTNKEITKASNDRLVITLPKEEE